MTSFLTRAEANRFRIEFETDSYEIYRHVQDICRREMDGNPQMVFTPSEVAIRPVCTGQGDDKKFQWGETIRYSPSEVEKILKGEYEKDE